MIDTNITPIESWNKYWQGTGDVGAFSSGGVSHPVIRNFWDALFVSAGQFSSNQSILDIATGNGALIEHAQNRLATEKYRFHCLDVSFAAIHNVHKRFPLVRSLVANANAIPFKPYTFDLVISQFGLEYAGKGAIYEGAQMVRKGGHLVLMLHHSGSSIFEECDVNLEAASRLLRSEFIDTAKQMIAYAFKASQGGDRSPYEDAAKNLQPAIRVVDEILDEFGDEVVGGTILRLYTDVDRIHKNLLGYREEEVLPWFDRVKEEIRAYILRMSAMKEAAIDEAGFFKACEDLRDRGFLLTITKPLIPYDQDKPLAWVLLASHKDADIGLNFSLEKVSGLTENTNQIRDEAKSWLKRRTENVVNDLMDRGVLEDGFFEAKPTWFYPQVVVIGKIRKPQSMFEFKWFVALDNTIDSIGGELASTPREAARYFALKWQLEVERSSSEVPLSDSDRDQRIREADTLYSLSEDGSIWPND